MSKKATTSAVLKGQDFRIHYRDEFWQSVFAMGDGNYQVTIEKKYRKRSLQQNAYLHGYLFPAVRELRIESGYRPHEMTLQIVKDDLKKMFLKTTIINEKTGEYIERVKHTSELTTVETMEFISAIHQWAAEYFGVKLLMPNEQTEMFNNEDK